MDFSKIFLEMSCLEVYVKRIIELKNHRDKGGFGDRWSATFISQAKSIFSSLGWEYTSRWEMRQRTHWIPFKIYVFVI